MVLVKKWPFIQSFFLGNIDQKMSFTIFQKEKMPFQAIKTRNSKSQKIDILPKGLTHGFGQKMAIFPTFFIRQYRPKIFFTIFQNEKMLFQAIKTRNPKSRKIDIFLNGLTHGFGPKIAILSTLFFQPIQTRKCLLRYSRTKKWLSWG